MAGANDFTMTTQDQIRAEAFKFASTLPLFNGPERSFAPGDTRRVVSQSDLEAAIESGRQIGLEQADQMLKNKGEAYRLERISLNVFCEHARNAIQALRIP